MYPSNYAKNTFDMWLPDVVYRLYPYIASIVHSPFTHICPHLTRYMCLFVVWLQFDFREKLCSPNKRMFKICKTPFMFLNQLIKQMNALVYINM